MSLKIENSRRVAKSRPVCMDLKGGIPVLARSSSQLTASAYI
jgi:hypothetical protein